MIAVAVCTYKRPQDLKRLLDSFCAIEAPEDRQFIVVDNDGSDPRVEAVVGAFRDQAGWAVHYVVETQPGISAARNAAFAKARQIQADLIAMVDDDEWVTPQWLSQLLMTRAETGAKVIGGPVRPVFSEHKQHWAKHASLWSVERDFLHGKPFVFCTCNFMLEMAVITHLGETPFPEAYGLTGGGDTAFFRGLVQRGVPMAWNEEAYIHEAIPDSRASLKWLRQRRYRMGNASYRWEMDVPVEGDVSPRLKTFAAIARLPLFPFITKIRGPLLLAWLLEFDKLRGRIAAQFGSHYSEYARPGEKTCR